MKSKLKLKKEALGALAANDLRSVGGAFAATADLNCIVIAGFGCSDTCDSDICCLSILGDCGDNNAQQNYYGFGAGRL